MSGLVFPYRTRDITAPRLGLIALQADETIEMDMRRMLPADVELMVSRVLSSTEVTSDTLAEMEHHLTTAASLFPEAMEFDALGYGCTSGTAQIGAGEVARRVRAGVVAKNVTEPLSALISACSALGIRKLALLSPYVASVSERLREALRDAGIDTPVFGSFDIGVEATVVRISPVSIEDAALALMKGADVDALFLSCTNLRALDVIAPLESALNKPVLASNQVLAWHMLKAVQSGAGADAPGRLFRPGS